MSTLEKSAFGAHLCLLYRFRLGFGVITPCLAFIVYCKCTTTVVAAGFESTFLPLVLVRRGRVVADTAVAYMSATAANHRKDWETIKFPIALTRSVWILLKLHHHLEG